MAVTAVVEVDGSAAMEEREEETEMEASGPESLLPRTPLPMNLRRRIGTNTAFRQTSWFS